MVRTKKVRFFYFFTSGSTSFQVLIWNDSKLVFVVENFFGLYFRPFGLKSFSHCTVAHRCFMARSS